MNEATERYFRGGWSMRRIIEDVVDGVIGEFWGEAQFEPDDEGLLCREEGVLRFRGQDLHADRGSLWRFPSPGEVEVRYLDGRPFHSFPLARPTAEHLCGDDIYQVHYTFGSGAWSSVWSVSGPNKSYRMMTDYRRVAEGSRPLIRPRADMPDNARGTGVDPALAIVEALGSR
ncbi:MAG: DUF6314 family protein [Pseudomonadota bacterium]